MNYSVLSPYKYGFCPGKSTQQAVFDFTKCVYSRLKNKKLFAALCLDVCIAFDCNNHDVLLFKLSHVGFTPATLMWFKSYLTCKQTVKYNDLTSDELNTKTGISQGTILGPLIFIFDKK